MKMKKKRWTIGLLCVVAILAAYGAWSKWFSPTRIAFVNYQVTELGQIAKANDNQFIRIEELPVEEIEKGIFAVDIRNQIKPEGLEFIGPDVPLLSPQVTLLDENMNETEKLDHGHIGYIKTDAPLKEGYIIRQLSSSPIVK